MCAKGDEDLVLVCHDAAARQNALVDLVDQHRVIFAEAVRGPGIHPFAVHGLAGAVAPCGNGKEGRIGLPIDKGVGVFMPVGGFDDVALGRGGDAELCLPVD